MDVDLEPTESKKEELKKGIGMAISKKPTLPVGVAAVPGKKGKDDESEG